MCFSEKLIGIVHFRAGDAALGQPCLDDRGVVFGDVQGGVDQIRAGHDLDDAAAGEVAFEFGPGKLGGLEVELGAQDVAGHSGCKLQEKMSARLAAFSQQLGIDRHDDRAGRHEYRAHRRRQQ